LHHIIYDQQFIIEVMNLSLNFVSKWVSFLHVHVW